MRQAERRKFHYIYKITRTDGSGKYYIGMHSTDDLEDGYFGSGQLLWKSIKKHGKENHSKEILEFLPSRKELRERERSIVNEEIVNDPLCMNLRLGGAGWDSFEAKIVAVKGNTSSKRDHVAICAKAHETRKKNGSVYNPAPATAAMAEKTRGSKWMRHGDVVKRVYKNQIEEHLASGWCFGR